MSGPKSIASTATANPPPRLDWRGWLCAALLAAVGFWAYTREQSFPFYYHDDEPGKTQQLIRGEFNFHHPLLLLDTTEGLMWAAGTPREAQPVVEKGRTASAIFAALSVAAMVMLTWQIGGPIAGTLAGVLTVTHPVLFELSHYMKEDCALLVGLTWTAVALVAYSRKPSLGRALLVGAAGGLAGAGKLLGLVMTGTALLAVALTRRPAGTRWGASLVALLAAVATFGIINIQAFGNMGRVASSISQEMAKIEKRGDEQAGRNEGIKFKHLRKLGTTLSAPVLLGFLYWFRQRWRARGPIVLRVLGCFVIGYFLIVSLSPKTKDRYMLPVYVLACGLGAAGLVEWTRRQPSTSVWRSAGPVLAVTAVAWHGPDLLANWRGFARDDRRDLIAWLRENVPPTAGIAGDDRALLPWGREHHLPGFDFPNPLLEPRDRRVAELGTIAELRARGIAYVVACEPDDHAVLPGGDKAKLSGQEGAFYEKLFATQKLVWERPPGPISYLNPGLRVYQLQPVDSR